MLVVGKPTPRKHQRSGSVDSAESRQRKIQMENNFETVTFRSVDCQVLQWTFSKKLQFTLT